MERVEKQLTAVEWLIEEAMKLLIQYMDGTLNEDTLDEDVYRIGMKAKEMEKEQKIKFAEHCLDKALDLDIRTAFSNVEHYYSQTFKSE